MAGSQEPRTDLRVVEEGSASLEAYSAIPIAFSVTSKFRVDPIMSGLAGFSIREEPVKPPYVKNYDDDDGERPLRWRQRWDLSNWGVFAAYRGEHVTSARLLGDCIT